jgi:hypothetical protein
MWRRALEANALTPHNAQLPSTAMHRRPSILFFMGEDSAETFEYYPTRPPKLLNAGLFDNFM